ncbi:hypothetical protein H5410_047332 [Solanum commersonii]|uniref:Uncharacterized protein n=1 Tax=Solanum commersonii TaxID=4109 RepID=A0A9J5XGU0_SOLCO|nr:hypothetical protein H5410_047332 [Solanum commersonii]
MAMIVEHKYFLITHKKEVRKVKVYGGSASASYISIFYSLKNVTWKSFQVSYEVTSTNTQNLRSSGRLQRKQNLSCHEDYGSSMNNYGPLSLLPIKLIFRCMIVCKLWYHILTFNFVDSLLLTVHVMGSFFLLNGSRDDHGPLGLYR